MRCNFTPPFQPPPDAALLERRSHYPVDEIKDAVDRENPSKREMPRHSFGKPMIEFPKRVRIKPIWEEVKQSDSKEVNTVDIIRPVNE